MNQLYLCMMMKVRHLDHPYSKYEQELFLHASIVTAQELYTCRRPPLWGGFFPPRPTQIPLCSDALTRRRCQSETRNNYAMGSPESFDRGIERRHFQYSELSPIVSDRRRHQRGQRRQGGTARGVASSQYTPAHPPFNCFFPYFK